MSGLSSILSYKRLAVKFLNLSESKREVIIYAVSEFIFFHAYIWELTYPFRAWMHLREKKNKQIIDSDNAKSDMYLDGIHECLVAS